MFLMETKGFCFCIIFSIQMSLQLVLDASFQCVSHLEPDSSVLNDETSAGLFLSC